MPGLVKNHLYVAAGQVAILNGLMRCFKDIANSSSLRKDVAELNNVCNQGSGCTVRPKFSKEWKHTFSF